MDDGRFGSRGAIGLGTVVVLLALGLRGFDLGHGLPVVSPDENWAHVFSLLDRAVGPHVLEPAARGAHFALLQLEYFAAFLTWQLGGTVPDYETFGLRMVEDPTRFWTVARGGIALLGAATVLILFRHGRRLGGGKVGALGAIFLAVAVRHVEVSRRVTPECACALFSFWALTLIVEAAMERREVPTWRFLFIGGAAARAGWPGILLLVPYFAAAVGRCGLRGAFSPRVLRPALYAGGLAVVAAIGMLPLTGGGVAEGVRAVTAGTGGATWGAGRMLMGSTGPALLLLAAIGSVMALRSGQPGMVLHVQYVLGIVVGLLVGMVGPVAIVTALPSLCLLAARALVDLADLLSRTQRAPLAAVAALGLVVTLEPALESWRLVRRDSAADTRVLAARWIEANLPPREAVVVPVDAQAPWRPQVPVADLRRNMKRSAPRVLREDPGGLPYWEASIRAERPRRYDLRLVDPEGVFTGAPEGEARSPASYAVVGPSDTRWSGETVAVFSPIWPVTKGPSLEIRRLVPDAQPAVDGGAGGTTEGAGGRG